MRRFRWCLGAVVLLTALVPLQGSAGSALRHSGPDRIDLPNGWQPEGVTTDGRFLYVGSLANGAIWRADSKTGEGDVLATGVAGSMAVGVDYDKRRDLLWVAGGSTKEIRVHDADTGRLVATYDFALSTDRFLNDLVVTRDAVYATDSANQELAVVPLGSTGHHDDHRSCSGRDPGLDHRGRGHDGDGDHGDADHDGGLPPPAAAMTLPLTGDLVYETGFNLNGIVESDGKLLAVQSNTGKLFGINPKTGDTQLVDVGGEPLVNGDGLELDNDILYVVLNQDNLIAVIELDKHQQGGELVKKLSDPDLDVPATVALARHSLWAANARFGTAATPETDPYWITRIDEFDD